MPVTVFDQPLANTQCISCGQCTLVCPVGALMKKRVGYAVPIGRRPYDHEPIGSEIEARRLEGTK